MTPSEGFDKFNELVRQIKEADLREKFCQWMEGSIKIISRENLLLKQELNQAKIDIKPPIKSRLEREIADQARKFVIHSENQHPDSSFVELRAELWVMK